MLSRRFFLGLVGAAPVAAGGGAPAAGAASRARPPLRVLRTQVNGTSYYQAAEAIGDLEVGDPVILRREAGNPHDRRAIEVLDFDDRKLGYVARIDNPAVARMMDAGERFAARVTRLDDERLDIALEIQWLRD